MTAYVSGNHLASSYIAQRRREDTRAVEGMLDGATALCAMLLAQLAHDNGRTKHEVLQEMARGVHRHEQKAQE